MSDTGEHDDHSVDQAHVTQALPQVIAVPPGEITTITLEAHAACLACRTSESHTRPVLDANRSLALDLLYHKGLATVA
jgi:hypothetical protein